VHQEIQLPLTLHLLFAPQAEAIQAFVAAKHLFKQLFNFNSLLNDKLGQDGEVRNVIAGQRFKDDVGLAAPLDLSAGGDALGVSKQDDLQENSGIVGSAAGVVVAVLGVKHRQVQLVLNQVMNGVFKGTGLELFLVVDDHHRILIVVVVLEAGHSDGTWSVF
jgi:hypothetical protein